MGRWPGDRWSPEQLPTPMQGAGESLTGHVVLIQLLEGEGDGVQFRQGHPEVLQHGALLPLRGRWGGRGVRCHPAPGQGAVTQHQLWACQAGGSAGSAGLDVTPGSLVLNLPRLEPSSALSRTLPATHLSHLRCNTSPKVLLFLLSPLPWAPQQREPASAQQTKPYTVTSRTS